ncbi:glycosyltransferase family 2 protein [Oceanicola sp. 22II-s10i]|uniref:glycosyltransferase family 2 protein n=1 Tax=Oceanicola sp. 22II-s10i TaxID=1317116 RepID=UPI000B5273A6|nr:glycosyltransferase family 2 protein [Oceanicola sp. 22II-s10i]
MASSDPESLDWHDGLHRAAPSPAVMQAQSSAALSASPSLHAPGDAATLRELFASGRIGETRMLDLAARALGTSRISLHLTPPDPALSGLLPLRDCLRHAMVPVRRDARGLTLATAYPETASRLTDILSKDIGPVRLVFAPRQDVHDHLSAVHRDRMIARIAARPAPEFSFRSHAPGRLALAALLFCAALLCVMAVAPGAVFGAIFLWAVVTLVVAMTLKTAAAIARLTTQARTPPPVPPLIRLPLVSILVPLYRERRIAEHLIRRLEAIEYPRGRLDVLIVLEETDETTAQAVAEAQLPPWIRVVTVPDGAPRTKPRAMNHALDFCRGEIIGIYDAEDAPDPDQILKVAAHFAAAPPEVVCLQGALDYYNPRQNWIARCFTVEYNTWFRLLLPGMGRLGFGLPLGGTTLFIRRAPLEEVGAWDAHNVTEDADLGFRLCRMGYRTEVIDTTTREEANCRPLRWIRQRSRWIKGYCVTYLVHMRRPLRLLRDLGPWRFAGFQAHFVTALSLAFCGPIIASGWALSLGLPHPAKGVIDTGWITGLSLLFIVTEALNLGLALIGTRRAEHRHLWPWVPTMVFYAPLTCIAASKALAELIVAPFYWDKTSHGLSLPERGTSTGAGDQTTGDTPPESSLSRVTKALEM